MNKYELMVIVDAAVPQADKDAVIKDVTGMITKNDGKVVNSQVWQEKIKLTFRLKKRTEGTYYLINFEANPASVTKIRQLLRLNEKILRSLILRAE